MIPELTGVVLAGGRSSRFGSNKALAKWDGATLAGTTVGSLLKIVPRVLVVAKNVAELAFLETARVQVVEDLHRDAHPMGGLATALQRLGTGRAFVCACDMPFIRPELIAALWDSRADYDAVIPVWRGWRQPLCGIYSPSCLDAVRASIERQELAIAGLFDSLRTRFLLEREIAAVDPQGLSFMDIDTREDYERARELLPC